MYRSGAYNSLWSGPHFGANGFVNSQPIMLILTLLFGAGVWAQNKVPSRLSMPAPKLVQKKLVQQNNSDLSSVRTELQLISDNFISEEFNATSEKNYQFLSFHIDNSAADYLLKMDMKGAYAIGHPLLSYLNVSDLFLRFGYSEEGSIDFGRKKMNWSELDRRWSFSVWEPIFRWNPLNSERQGLTGVFWNHEQDSFELNLFASPFYLPDQGPNFEINENGEFVRANPWFQRPPDSIRIMSEVSKAEYTFERPDETRIVLQRSYGGRFYWKAFDRFSWQVAYAYKPMNQLALGYDGQLDIPTDRVNVTIHPEVTYHHVSGSDLVFKSKYLKLGLSALWDQPVNEDRFDEKWTYPEYHSSTLLSPFVDVKLGQAWILSLQHLQVLGGEIEERGKLASPDRPSISKRYAFQEAEKIALHWLDRWSHNHSFKGQVSYTFSQKNEFDLIKTEVHWWYQNQWHLFNELQLVRAEKPRSDNYSEISQFANHDRVVLGAGYDF